MKISSKRIISFILFFVMLATCLPTGAMVPEAYAADEAYRQETTGYFTMKNRDVKIMGKLPYRFIKPGTNEQSGQGQFGPDTGVDVVYFHQLTINNVKTPVYCMQPYANAGSYYTPNNEQAKTLWNAWKVAHITVYDAYGPYAGDNDEYGNGKATQTLNYNAADIAAHALYWGYPSYIDTNYTNEENQAALQAMIFDISCGFVVTKNGEYVRRRYSKFHTNGDETDVSNYYMSIGFSDPSYGVDNANVIKAYNALLKRMNSSSTNVGIPSFANESSIGVNDDDANIIDLSFDSATNKYKATVTDSLGFAKYYDFEETKNGITVEQNGNKVTISVDKSTVDGWNAGSIHKMSTKKSNTPNVNVSVNDVNLYGDTSDTNYQAMVMYIGETPEQQKPKAYIAVRAESMGEAQLIKVSDNPDLTSGNDCYSLAGAVYGVYKKKADANNGENEVGRLTTKANGKSNVLDLSAGNYWVKELTAPKGFALDTVAHKITVEPGETAILNVTDEAKSDPVPIWLKKVDAAIGTEGETSGKMGLAGAEFTVKYYDGIYNTVAKAEESGDPTRTWVIKTNENGVADLRRESCFVSGDDLYYDGGEVAIPIGTVVIQETKAPAGYILNAKKFLVKIDESGSASVIETYNAPIIPETAIKGGVKVKKVDEERAAGQGNATLAGAEFTIYNKCGKSVIVDGTTYANNAAVKTIETNSNGVASTAKDLLPYGTYLIKETKASPGYKINSDWSKTFTISENEVIIDLDTMPEPLIRGGLKLNKIDHELSGGQGAAELGGAKFTIYNASDKPVVVEGTTYAVGAAVKVIETNDSGVATTGNGILPYGTYTVKETKAPKGYKLNSTWSATVNITTASVVTVDNNCPDDVIRGGAKVTKSDVERADGQGNGTYEGAEFTIYNKSGKPVVVAGKTYADGAAVGKIVTDGTGSGSTAADLLPYGSYTMKETKAPAGYKLNTEWSKDFTIRTEGSIANAGICKDEILRGGISIKKIDSVTTSAQGNATLAGAEFSIYNASDKPVMIDGTEYAKGALVKVITANSSGVASTGNGVLPYGKYTVKETKAPTGYKLNSSWSATVEVNKANVIAGPDCPEPVIRGGVKVTKSDVERGAGQGNGTFKGAVFTIYNASTHNVTVEGKDCAPGAVVKTIETNDAGVASTAADLLPYGKYTMKETKAPAGYKLNTEWSKEFTITTDGNIVNAGTCTDEILRGGLKVTKIDKTSTTAQGAAELKGAEFTIYNASDKPVVVEGHTYAVGEAVKTIVVKDNGVASTAKDLLPYGKYTVKETKAPKGYNLNTSWSKTVTISSANVIVDAATCPDTVILGRVRVQKKDADMNTLQGDAIFKGAQFTIYNENEAPVTVNGTSYEKGAAVLMIEASEAGVATSAKVLPYGKYSIKETKAPVGYKLNAEWRQEFTIAEENVIVEVGTCAEPIIRGGINVQKVDADQSANPQGGAVYAGAEFTIYNASGNPVLVEGNVYAAGDAVKTIIADETGFAQTEKDLLPYGTYTVKETKAPAGYMLNEDWSSTVKVTKQNTRVFAGQCPNIVMRGGIKVVKQDAEHDGIQGEATFEGAEFTIYNNSGKSVVVDGETLENGAAVKTIVTDETGMAATAIDLLPYGKYIVRETKAPVGYDLNRDFEVEVFVNSNEFMFDAGVCKDNVTRGGLSVQKMDAGLDAAHPYGDASFEGIVFSISNASANDVVVGGETFAPGAEITQIVTDKTGFATTENDLLPYGKYTVREISIPEGNGYALNENYVSTVMVDTYHVVIEANPCKDEGNIFGSIRISKFDADTLLAKPQGDASLAGAKFVIINESKNPVIVDGHTYGVGDEIMEVTTDENGVAVTEQVFPMGTYRVKEVEPSEGYLNNDDWSAVAVIREDGQQYDISFDDSCKEIVIRGGVLVQKLDKDTNENHGIGGLEMKDAEFIIINRSAEPVVVNGISVNPYDGEFDLNSIDESAVVMRIYTDEDAVASTGDHDLPYGTYEIHESVAPAGYRLNTEWVKTFKIEEDGTIVRLDGEDAIIDEISRSDLQFNKEGVKGNNYEPLPGVVFKLTNVETGESHIVVTDVNGSFDSASNPHSYKTNANDAALLPDGTLDESKIDPEAGIWFGGGRPVDQAPNGMTVGALTCGTYLLEELECEGNRRYDLCDPNPLTVIIYKRPITSESYHFGTVTDSAPEGIRTVLLDKDTQIHQAAADGKITLIDTVSFDGVRLGKTYTVKGVLMDKATEAPLVVDGKTIEAEKTFVAMATSGTVNIAFTFDASELAGRTVVAFEKLYLGTKLLAEHEDIDSEDQTVSFPSIRTIAHNEKNGKMIDASEEITLIDTVYYSNLEPGVTYELKAQLMDADTGKELRDDNNDPIVATATFKPKSRNGQADVTFRIKASVIEGKIGVVFEELYIGPVKIADHKDIDDEDQTIYFPKIRTTLADSAGAKIIYAGENVELIDVVKYEGVVPGQTYKLTGTLMSRETGSAILDKNGDKIESSASFTAKESSGTVEVKFVFDASALDGSVLVAYETLFDENGPVVSHEDINDEGQTVRIPSVKTSAHDAAGNSELYADEVVTIIDDVKYDALIVGEKYTVKGVLMDKETGAEVLKANGKPVVAEKTFVAEAESGTISLTFELKRMDLAGRTLVAFEKLYYGEALIADHSDIDDEDQTIHFPKIRTSFVDDAEHHVAQVGTVKLTDHVYYENLKPGHEYTVTGALVRRVNGKAVKLLDESGDQYVAEAKFKADENGSGVVDIVFEIDSTQLADQSVVAFEKLLDLDRVIALHEDVDDEDQTVHFPTISTVATDGKRNKIVDVSHGKNAKIKDVVRYKNLVPGLEYTVSGVLRVKENGGVVKDANGEAIVSEVKFTPEKSSGKVTVEFSIPYESVQGKHLVAIETLLLDASTVAVHDDMEDEDQTVYVPYEQKVYKYNATNHKPVAGAEFEITDITFGAAENGQVQTAISDKTGYVYFDGLPGHEYALKETRLPAGYIAMGPTEFFVTVKEDGSLEGDLEIGNVRGGTVVITKVDVITGDPVEGCEVTIYRIKEKVDKKATQKAIEEAAAKAGVPVEEFDSSKVEPIMKEASRKEVFKQTTDKNGRIYFYTTTPGKYVYKETMTRTGYYLNEDEYTFEVAEDLTVTGTVRFHNVPFGTVVIKKFDKSGAPLQGAEIAIYEETTNKFLGKGVTGANGRLYFVSPGPGKYYFVETKAPEGYKLISDHFHFEIASDYTVTGTVSIINDRTPEITKTGDTNNIWLWVGLAAFAVTATVGIGIYFLKGKKSRKEE